MWERIPAFFATAGDIQAKPTRVSVGLDHLVNVSEVIARVNNAPTKWRSLNSNMASCYKRKHNKNKTSHACE